MTEQFQIPLLNDNELKHIKEDILIQALGHSMQIKIFRRFLSFSPFPLCTLHQGNAAMRW